MAISKIKEIKIREDDGSYSDAIPIGADAINIDYENDSTVSSELDKLNNDNDINKTNIQNNATNIELQKTRIDNLASLDEGSTTGDAELIDGRIGYNNVNYKSIGDAIRDQISSIHKIIDIGDEKLEDISLEITENQNQYINGNIYNNEYVCMGKANVIPGEEIIFTGKSQQNVDCPAIAFYDENNNFISKDFSTGIATVYINQRMIIPKDKRIKYCIINGSKPAFNAYPKLQKVIKNNITDYIDLSIEAKKSVLYKKKIISNGDSITKGQGFYGNTKGDKSYVNIIAEKYDMTCNNYAVSGATICSGSNTSVYHISDEIKNMDKDTDYIIISGGYNDYLYNTPLGILTDDYNTNLPKKTTLIGGMEYLCRELLKYYSGKKIGFIFTHKIKTSPYTNNDAWDSNVYNMNSAHNAMIQVLNKYSIPYCDLYNTSTFNTDINNYLKYTANNDGTHPTEEGYKLFYCDKVEKFLESL